MARRALLGANQRSWKATMSSRVMAATDASVPEPGMPYGWNP